MFRVHLKNLIKRIEILNRTGAIVTREGELTTGSGASDCWHIIHGTPVLSPTAIWAAHLVYAFPGAP